MQQAWHIFKKDSRYLAREIVFLIALATLTGCLTRGGPRGEDVSDTISLLYIAAVGFTIARLVHAEAIPGDNQFWITRPYRWSSLLAAKLLFLIAFVHLPVLIMQAEVLLLNGFPIGAIIPGLIWTQLLILLSISLPACALAAMTPGMVPFMGAILGLAALAFTTLGPRAQFNPFGTPECVEWARYCIPFMASAIAVPPVLFIQYKYRQTRLAAILGGGIAVCGAAVFALLPWSALFSVQSLLSKQNLNIEITNDSQPADVWPSPGNGLSLSQHFSIRGLPPGVYPQIEWYDPQMQVGDGPTVHLTPARSAIRRQEGSPNEFVFYGDHFIGPKNAENIHGLPFKIRVSFFVTLIGNARDQSIPFRRTPVDGPDGLRCFDGDFGEFVCHAPFRWPATFVAVKSPWGGLTSFTRLISYSPFPANLQLDPIATRSTSPYWPKDKRPTDVTIESEEPLAYVRCDVEMRPNPAGAQ
jgi:hypothetical protein